jgi:glutamine amidotransferase-like uncharacterized protein
MPYTTYKKPLRIAIYDTKGSSGRQTHNAFQRIIQEENLEKQVRLQLVSGTNIREGILSEDDIGGLILPGRYSGTDYRNELGEDGFRLINTEIQKGMNGYTVCAGTYTLSSETYWEDQSSGIIKKVKSAYAVFKGISKGPVAEWYQNSYGLPSSVTRKTKQYGHPFSIVTVYTNEEDPQPITVKYGGGGEFIPDHDENAEVLLRHANHKPAAIRVRVGKGVVDMYNVHPEAGHLELENSAGNSPYDKFDERRHRWKKDGVLLKRDQPKRDEIMLGFVENCLMGEKSQRYLQRLERYYQLARQAP